MILVDFQCGAELYRQSRQDVVTRHQEQGLAIDFLSGAEREIFDQHPSLISSRDRNSEQKGHSNLILESRGLLLEPCRFEVIDDVGNPPVGRIRQLAVLHWAVESQ